jgi:hypothetical protein
MSKKRKQTRHTDEKKSTDIEREIKEAVERIPEMIEHTMRDQEDTQEKKTRTQKIFPAQSGEKKIYLLWASVIAVSLLIFGMWVWNLRSVFSDVSEGRAVNETPFSNIEENFRQAIDLVDPEEIPPPKQKNAASEQTSADDSSAIKKITAILQGLTTSTVTSTQE